MDNKGHKAETEMAAYEIRLFCEMLIKGAVNMFEVRRMEYVLLSLSLSLSLSLYRCYLLNNLTTLVTTGNS